VPFSAWLFFFSCCGAASTGRRRRRRAAVSHDFFSSSTPPRTRPYMCVPLCIAKAKLLAAAPTTTTTTTTPPPSHPLTLSFLGLKRRGKRDSCCNRQGGGGPSLSLCVCVSWTSRTTGRGWKESQETKDDTSPLWLLLLRVCWDILITRPDEDVCRYIARSLTHSGPPPSSPASAAGNPDGKPT
jgi:hypothetical protein